MSDSVLAMRITRIKALGRLIRGRLDKKSEKELFRIFVVLSLAVHFIFFLIQGIELFNQRQALVEEWAIDADLMIDATSGAPLDSALPNSQKADEAKVSDRMLPQLPKQFAVDSAPTEALDKTFTEHDEKAEEAKPQESSAPKFKEEVDEKNRLKKDEALRRLALERLRNEAKLAKKTEAPSSGDARLADSSKDLAKANSGLVSGTVTASDANRYKARVQVAVRRNYSIPDTLKFRAVEPVILGIELNAGGALTYSRIEESSGDSHFDELAFAALRASDPLPPPPAGLVNQRILLKFSP